MNDQAGSEFVMDDIATAETTCDEVVLDAREIYKSYESGADHLDVLTGIDLKVYKGSIIAILGASGVGKSTLLHILGTLDRPTSGEVVIDKVNVFDLDDDRLADFRNRTIGFVFQGHHLLPEFSALENVMMPLLISRHDWQESEENAHRLLKDVGLEGRLHHKPGELSGGEQQRVAVARALAGSPGVIMADEPSGNLDRNTGAALLDMIWQLSRNYQQAFVIVTHDEAIGRRADRMYELSDGILKDVTMEQGS